MAARSRPASTTTRGAADRPRWDDVVARAESVSINGPWARFRCPIHDDENPSGWAKRLANGDALVGCFAGCQADDIAWALLGMHVQRQVAASRQGRTAMALRTWDGAKAIHGTLAETYLRARRCYPDPPPDTLRFMPRCYHPSGIYLPALVARVDDVDGVFVAVHRTYLSPYGRAKAAIEPAKAALGPVSGGAVRLAPVAATLLVGEGLENALTAAIHSGLPAWAALSAPNLAKVKLPPEVRAVVIAADHDEPGLKAANELGRRLLSEGRSVKVAKPPKPGQDFNDLVMEQSSNE
jgi:Toprim domain-containing protein